MTAGNTKTGKTPSRAKAASRVEADSGAAYEPSYKAAAIASQ